MSKDKNNADAKLSFPISRFQHMSNHSTYYPFGNTPAEDLLENCGDTSLPSVLCLGCGDLRSCFYTLWKHFDPNISTAPKRFDGVRFTLNDIMAAILARNIIFLYMCMKLPKEKEEKKKWLCAMWAIWYSFELYSHHLEILNSVLQKLISFSESSSRWSSKDNPLHSIVEFNSPSCFSEVAAMWKQWLGTGPDVPTKQKIHEMRCRVQGHEINDNSEQGKYTSIIHTFIYPDSVESCSNKVTSRAREVASYFRTGCCLAEFVFGFCIPPKRQTMLNLTMIGSKDWANCCYYGLVPFESYYHTIEFTKRKMRLHKSEDIYNCFVPEESFKSNPFLSNCVQQFCMWIQSSSRALNNKNLSVSFCLDNQHCLSLCQQQIQFNQMTSTGTCKYSKLEYDIINTSNLMDHLSPSNLLVACKPLIKNKGVLIMTTMSCRYCTNTGEELLSLCFGFSTQLFPVILGVRCISHEGPEYCNPVKINPSPPDLSHEIKIIPHHVRTFVWVKEPNAQQFAFPQLPEVSEGNITDALVNILGSCSYSILNYGPGESFKILTYNTIETAISMLKLFLSHTDNIRPSYSYWEPMCKSLRNFSGPFLQSLQTQLLLNDIHVHLTVLERNCPKCKQKPLQKYIGLFGITASVYCPYTMFIIFVHQCSTTSADFLLKEALSKKDVHIFDCFEGTSLHDQVNMKFFVPLQFSRLHYRVTLVRVYRRPPPMPIFMETINSCKLKDIQKSWTKYNFSPVQSSEFSGSPPSPELGSVFQHICDSHLSKTEFSLSEQASEYVKTDALTTSKKSSRHITLHCRDLKYDLHFNFPIDYSSLKIAHKSEDRVLITCKRQPYSLKEERPCFIATPDHMISLPVYALDPYYLTKHANMQITEEDRAVLGTKPLFRQSAAILNMAELVLREFLQPFFKFALNTSFFYLQTTGGTCNCLIVINKVLFDYKHKTPAIDLAYCFVDNFEHSSVIISNWNSLVDSSNERIMSVDKESLAVLGEVLGYFARRTNGTLQSAGDSSKYFILKQLNLDCYYTRAVVYALLRDPDQVLYGTEKHFLYVLMNKNFMPVIGGEKCVNCDKFTFTAQHCGKCKAASYCSKACQTKNWQEHKKECVLSEAFQPRCNYCQTNLRKGEVKLPPCKCNDVQYCSLECLEYDQANHSKACEYDRQMENCRKITELYSELCSCNYCHLMLLWSEECTKCSQAHYCDSECRAKHMSEHLKECIGNKIITTEHAKLLFLEEEKCNHCQQISSNLKKCTNCKKVKYCNITCQKNDWPNHKEDCRLTALNKAKEDSSYPRSSSFLAKSSHDSASSAPTSYKSTPTPTSSTPASTSSKTSFVGSPSSSTCQYCNILCPNLKKCSRCLKAEYCGASCQRKDWPKHKLVCQKASVEQVKKDVMVECSYCQKESTDLKKCAKCGRVQYCGRSCQRSHWPQHKVMCDETLKKLANSSPATSRSLLGSSNSISASSSTTDVADSPISTLTSSILAS